MTPEIQAYLSRGGRIRRFDEGVSGNPIVILEWVRQQGFKVSYIGKGRIQFGRAKITVADLFERANAMRKAKGLEPFTLGPVNPRAHFCFNTAPGMTFRPAKQQAAE